MAQELAGFMGLTLSHSELLYVLNAFQTTRIVGMEFEEFSWPHQKLDALLTEGEQSLIARSLLHTDEQSQTRLLAPELIGVVGALALRDRAFILTQTVRGMERQTFMFNLYEDLIVEHIRPQEGVHHLVTFDTPQDLVKRVASLSLLQIVAEEDRPGIQMAQTEFEGLVKLVQDGDSGQAISILVAGGLSQDLAALLVQTLQDPEVIFSLAYLEWKQDTIVDALSVSVFADEHSSWGVWLGEADPESPKWRICPAGINDIWPIFMEGLSLEERPLPVV